MSTQRLTLLGLCLLGGFYLSFAKQWVSQSERDKHFNEYTSRMLRVAVAERRPVKDVRELLLVKAEELAMPLRHDQIEVGGAGGALHVDVRYEDDIILPVLNRPLYRRTFEHYFEPSIPQ